ncbi:ABC transporter permease [Aquamicrobium terrae]
MNASIRAWRNSAWLEQLQTWRMIRPSLSRLVRFFHISLLEARSERQASYLGIFWKPLSTLLFTAMLAFVFHQAHVITTGEFYLYVLSGYILWTFISASITGSTTVIQKRFDFAVHNNLTLVGLFWKLLIDRLFTFGLDIILLIAAIIIIAPAAIGWNFLLLPPLLIIISLVSIGISYLVNLLVILFPDLDAIFNVGVRFMFFVSPIFWGAEGAVTGVRAVLLSYNPAAYFLSTFRQAFGVMPLQLLDWLVSLAMALLLCVVSLIAYKRSEKFVRNLK